MNFEVNKDVIVEGFKKVSKVLSNNTSIPILGGILLEASMEELCLTASNSSETIRHCIPVDGADLNVLGTGKTVIPKSVVDIVKKCNKEIHFTLEGYSLNLISGKKDFNFNCLDPEEYPKLPMYKLDRPTFTLKGNEFHDMIRKTAYAASTSETRPILQGVCFELQDGNCRMVCTDSHRLARVNQKSASEKDALKVVVPAKSFDNATKVFDLSQDVDVFIENQNHILFRNHGTMFLSRLLDGSYPDTSRLIPESHKSVMTINRAELFDSIDSLKEIASASDSNNSSGVVKLHVNGVATFTTASNQRGKGKIVLPYDHLDGDDDFTISFSCKYALDALKTLDSDLVEMKFQGDMRPFLICPVGEHEALEELQLILPVRTY
ncbi:DNA polymerase III subunit beta [Rossellomorea arthrocnemi]|uniref:DNA polymerase III subunit beta n=1 Tax=Rossellomorea arthrocnemi TaxID=2769542 RepID=UPI001919E62C|nr:DNA polymerase III subunit beta [Rossellomorea arthrocnemi]